MTAGTVLARAEPSAKAERVVRIQRSHRFITLNLGELWAFRDLLFLLVWRDIKVRYKQSVLGAGWAVIQPLTSMIIFSVIFGKLAGLKSQYDVPYPLFVYAGLLPWMYFASSLTLSSQSLIGNANLVTKVYFPRLLLPLASIVTPIVDFLIAFVVLIGLGLWYHWIPTWHVVTLPAFLFVALLAAFGIGLWLAAINVRYRDVPYAVPFVIQLWFYATPVIYDVTLVPKDWRWLLALNPMTGVVDGFRWSVLGTGAAHLAVFATSAAVGVVLTLTGLLYFKHVERRFADVI
jgi:lipopolysaccharide transport system permease protein